MASFELAIPTVLSNEGGYVNDPSDSGGETNFGISKRSYPSIDIKNLTKESASDIYRRDFWKFDGISDQNVATKIFDAFVNGGRAAIKVAQSIVSTPEDGNYGPHTEAAINAVNPSQFLSEYREALVQRYERIVEDNPDNEKFLKGWLRRARQ